MVLTEHLSMLFARGEAGDAQITGLPVTLPLCQAKSLLTQDKAA